MKIEKFKVLGISLVTLAVLMAAPVSMSHAADAAKKETKAMSCKQEAKKAGIDKKELKKYIAECKKTRKAAKKVSDKK